MTHTEIELAARGESGLSGLLSVPDGPDAVPVLLFLHGRGEARTGSDGMPQPLRAVGTNDAPVATPTAQERFAVLAPQAPTSMGVDVWAGHLDSVAALLSRARRAVAARDDGRLFVCGFSHGAFAAVEFAGANARGVTAWVAVDAARRLPVARPLAESAGRLPHRVLAGPAGFRRNGAAPGDPLARDEIRVAGLSHVEMCREVYSGRFRLDSGDSVYDWLLHQGRPGNRGPGAAGPAR